VHLEYLASACLFVEIYVLVNLKHKNRRLRNSFEDVVADVHENNKLTGESVRYCSSNGELLDDIVMVL
jgi:hypothetical protein